MDTLLDEFINKGIEQGIEQGRAEGGNLMVYSMVQNRYVTPENGAKCLGISVEKLKDNMLLTGYLWPEDPTC